jgi:hypothetical protein
LASGLISNLGARARVEEVAAGVLRDGARVADPRERRREVQQLLAAPDARAARRLPALGDGSVRGGQRRQQLLHRRHPVGGAAVGQVGLAHRELGIVPRGEPLVAEVAPDLEHALEAAHQQPLEVQLRRDAQEELHVQRVVVRDERPRRRAAGDGLQQRRLHLEEAAPLQEGPQVRDDGRARAEAQEARRVGDEVHVALPVARLDVREAVPLGGRRREALGQQLAGRGEDGDLAHARAPELAPHGEEVAEVQGGQQQLPGLLAQHLGLAVDLDAAAVVAQVQEQALAVVAAGGHASRHGDDRARRRVRVPGRQHGRHGGARRLGDARARGPARGARGAQALQLDHAFVGQVHPGDSRRARRPVASESGLLIRAHAAGDDAPPFRPNGWQPCRAP